MKLKTLLLGSAAAMVAFTGAQAADAVIAAEPEAVEYVRVCDLYGSGFFYIPGTETCLKLSGSMRVQYEYNTDGTVDAPTQAAVGQTTLVTLPAGTNAAGNVPANGTFVGTTTQGDVFAVSGTAIAGTAGTARSSGSISYRARVNFDARNETDFGTLRSFVRLEGNGSDEASGGVVVHTAVTSLGGLSFGYGDTFFTTNTAYGHPGNMLDGQYDYDQSVFMQYTFAAGGFSATAGIQGGVEADDRQIDVYAGASYAADLFSVHGTVIYDSSVEEIAYAAALIVKPIDGLTIKGWYQGDEGETQYIGAGGDYQYGIGAAYAVLDNVSIGAGYSVADGSSTNAGADVEEYVVGFAWQPVSGLNVQGDYRHQDFGSNDVRNVPGLSDDNDTYRIRITRSW